MQTTLSQKKIFNLQVSSIDIILYLDYILKHNYRYFPAKIRNSYIVTCQLWQFISYKDWCIFHYTTIAVFKNREMLKKFKLRVSKLFFYSGKSLRLNCKIIFATTKILPRFNIYFFLSIFCFIHKRNNPNKDNNLRCFFKL